jgi:hypothetical protein
MSLETLKAKVEELIKKAQNAGNTDELEAIIDNSGVLDSTEGTVEEKVEQLVDKAEWEKAWYKQTENMTTAQGLFFKFGVGEDTPNGYPTIPRTNLVKCTNFNSFCEYANIEYVDYLIECKAISAVTDRMFFRTTVKRIKGFKGKISSAISMFHASSIEEIVEPLDFSAMSGLKTQNAFNCSNLREVRFVTESIKWSITFTAAVLSAESIQSIIDGLATVETAQILTLHKDVKAKLTQTQLDTITGKNWSLA